MNFRKVSVYIHSPTELWLCRVESSHTSSTSAKLIIRNFETPHSRYGEIFNLMKKKNTKKKKKKYVLTIISLEIDRDDDIWGTLTYYREFYGGEILLRLRYEIAARFDSTNSNQSKGKYIMITVIIINELDYLLVTYLWCPLFVWTLIKRFIMWYVHFCSPRSIQQSVPRVWFPHLVW